MLFLKLLLIFLPYSLEHLRMGQIADSIGTQRFLFHLRAKRFPTSEPRKRETFSTGDDTEIRFSKRPRNAVFEIYIYN